MLPSDIPLPDFWPAIVRVAILHVQALARFVLSSHRSNLSTNTCPRRAELEQELRFLREELRIKDARMESIPPRRRPDYEPRERFDILALRASRGCSCVETATRFFVTEPTIRSWTKRVETDGSEAFISAGLPVNRFPDLVGDIVRRLKQCCPELGKRSIANFLARCGLHLGTTTVGRFLKERLAPPDEPNNDVANDDNTSRSQTDAPTKAKIVTAKHPNHLWHVDLTLLPIGGGFWTTWLPFSLPQMWPFCWWLVVIEDYFSRRVIATETFARQPTAEEIVAVLDRAAKRAKTYPKHIICDQGSQFTSDYFESWAKANDVRVRYGAVGQHGSIAVIERLIKTIKYTWFRLGCDSKDAKSAQARLDRCRVWHNRFRPHEALIGATPDEVYYAKPKANEKPRYEPRVRWPRGSPRGKLMLEVRFFHNDRAPPIVRLKRAA